MMLLYPVRTRMSHYPVATQHYEVLMSEAEASALELALSFVIAVDADDADDAYTMPDSMRTTLVALHRQLIGELRG